MLSQPSNRSTVKTHPRRAEIPAVLQAERVPQQTRSCAPLLTRLLHLFNKDAGKAGSEHRGDLHRARLCLEPCQQAAWEEQASLAASSRLWWSADFFFLVVAHLGFPQGQGWAVAIGSPSAFWAWVRQVYNPLAPGMRPCGAYPATAPVRAGADHASYEPRRGKAAVRARAEPVLLRTAACLAAPRGREISFLGVSTYQRVPGHSC